MKQSQSEKDANFFLSFFFFKNIIAGSKVLWSQSERCSREASKVLAEFLIFHPNRVWILKYPERKRKASFLLNICIWKEICFRELGRGREEGFQEVLVTGFQVRQTEENCWGERSSCTCFFKRRWKICCPDFCHEWDTHWIWKLYGNQRPASDNPMCAIHERHTVSPPQTIRNCRPLRALAFYALAFTAGT